MDRQAMLDRLAADATPWDVIVIGGGATGLGCAVDAAARGYRTVLLEQSDFAKGTSSRSTKLVHGGVRYLQQGNVRLVFEGVRERGLLLRNAPHLVRRLPFVVPHYAWWEAPFYGFGLKLYDALAGRLSFGPSRHLSREATLAALPTLEAQHLRGGTRYFDGQFDDARLAIALARTAADLGAVVLNYAPVRALLKREGRVAGVRARDEESGREFELPARVVVNATGVFGDHLRRLDEPDAEPMIAPSQGSHIVLDRTFLPGTSALMVPRTDDGRVLFAIPWHGRVIVGTTDTPVGDTALEPRPLREEIEFLLAHAARYLAKDPRPTDVLSTFAGLRPLVRTGRTRNTSLVPRDHTVLVSNAGLVTVTGGKWTTYRRMAEDAVDRAAAVGGLAARPSRTASLPLRGAENGAHAGAVEADADCASYGADTPAVAALARSQPGWAEPLHPALACRSADVAWAVRHEMARTVEDVLARRTRALLLDARASIEVAPVVARLMARALGRDEAWEQTQVRAFEELARGYLLAG